MRLLWCVHSHAEHVRVLGPLMALPEDLRSALLRTYGRESWQIIIARCWMPSRFGNTPGPGGYPVSREASESLPAV